MHERGNKLGAIRHGLFITNTPPPFPALLANAIIIFITFLLCIPALLIPTSRTSLKIHGWFVVICAVFTLILGINEWLQTLTLRANLLTVWGEQPDKVQSLVQQKVGHRYLLSEAVIEEE